jgi:hypothetical protein
VEIAFWVSIAYYITVMSDTTSYNLSSSRTSASYASRGAYNEEAIIPQKIGIALKSIILLTFLII